MSAPPSGPSLPKPESITASLLLGAMFNWALWGVLGCQTYLYHIYFPNDKAAFKYLIYGVFLFETAQTALNTHDTYIWFSRGFGDFLNFTKVLTSPLNTPMMGAVIALVVQLFYAHRIWTLRKSWLWFCMLLVGITLAQTGGAFYGGIRVGPLNKPCSLILSEPQAFQAGSFVKAQTDPSNRRAVYVWLIGEAVADVLIAAAMVYLMILRRGQSHRFRSHGILARVVTITVESNCATASLAILSLIMSAGIPDTNYFTCPYANTLLVSFNNRIVLRNLSQIGSPSFSSGSNIVTSSRLPLQKSTPSSAGRAFESDTITYTVHRFTETDSTTEKMDHELQETSAM
ncbi:hypothetical protein WG66_016031, partial [Moniliophthora roreri]